MPPKGQRESQRADGDGKNTQEGGGDGSAPSPLGVKDRRIPCDLVYYLPDPKKQCNWILMDRQDTREALERLACKAGDMVLLEDVDTKQTVQALLRHETDAAGRKVLIANAYLATMKSPPESPVFR